MPRRSCSARRDARGPHARLLGLLLALAVAGGQPHALCFAACLLGLHHPAATGHSAGAAMSCGSPRVTVPVPVTGTELGPALAMNDFGAGAPGPAVAAPAAAASATTFTSPYLEIDLPPPRG